MDLNFSICDSGMYPLLPLKKDLSSTVLGRKVCRTYRRALEISSAMLWMMPTSTLTRGAFDIGSDVSGLVVTGVQPGSGIEDKGLQAGDVLVEVSSQPARSLSDMRTAIDAAGREGRSSIPLLENSFFRELTKSSTAARRGLKKSKNSHANSKS